MGKRIWGHLFSIGAGVAVLLWAHQRSGGSLEGFLQWPAAVIVFGGTFLALAVSYPVSLLGQSVRAVWRAWSEAVESPDALIPVFSDWAGRAKRGGLMAVEREIRQVSDPFLGRALALAVSGVDDLVVRQTLEVEHRVTMEREEEFAQVFEAAGGYAPTLGIVAAVLGLMRAMQDLSTPAAVGAGIAAAFVATIYGLCAANLVFLPLATRLRTHSRLQAIRREFTIDGVLALHGGLHPRMVQERLTGYMAPSARDVEVA